VARLCRWTGLIRLAERAHQTPSLLVLAYHRIGHPELCPYDTDLFSATPEDFEEQVAYLKSRFHVVSLTEVRQLVGHPAKWRHSMALITFDDGYIDNYTVAFPILSRHGLEGSFFLPTGFVGTRRLPWWDGIAYLVRQSVKSRISIRHPLSIDLDLSRGAREAAVRRAIALCKLPSTTSTSRFLDLLAEACGVEVPVEAPERLFLDWSEAADMLRHGMAVGSHTQSHELLRRLSGEAEYDELSGSRDILRRRLGGEVTAIAYPVGSLTSFSSRTCTNAERAGYDLGFSFYGGINLPAEVKRFDLQRVNIGRELSLPLFRLRTTVPAIAGRRLFPSPAGVAT
jgi:peptidoglycan/xylan/chitin deacetylase (PgdA/CDA1 family)